MFELGERKGKRYVEREGGNASFGSSKLEIEPELAARIYIARENDEKSKKFLGRGGNCFINIFFPRYLMPLLQPSSNSRRAISRLHQCAGAAQSTTLIYYIGIQDISLSTTTISVEVFTAKK